MKISELMNNPEMYIDKEITLNGVVHKIQGKDMWYLAEQELNSLDILSQDHLLLDWETFTPQSNNVDRESLKNQLIYLLSDNVSIDAQRIKRHFNDHSKRAGFVDLVEVFGDNDSTWKSIQQPFMENEFETMALDLFDQLDHKPYTLKTIIHPKIQPLVRKTSYKCWRKGHITGTLNKPNGDMMLTNVWKAMIPLLNCDIYIVARNRRDFLNHFGNKPSIPLKQVLFEPEKYYKQQITIQGLFTNDVIRFEENIAYTRLVPNRLYYEYRSKWDNRVSIHLKPTHASRILLQPQDIIPGEKPQNAPNRDTSEVRITGTLYPPENEYSSIILDDITELVSMHNGLIHHWKPKALEHGFKLDYRLSN